MTDAARLKIAVLDEERLGGLLMIWWNGDGAARVLAYEDKAILMERAEDGTSLADVLATVEMTHHSNVLNFGSRGWLAIDPKGLIGEWSFDYANLFCNPDLRTAIKAGRLARQVNVVAEAANLERDRLLAWIVAWAGLSAAFSINDGLAPDDALRIAELAAVELSGC